MVGWNLGQVVYLGFVGEVRKSRNFLGFVIRCQVCVFYVKLCLGGIEELLIMGNYMWGSFRFCMLKQRL